MALHLTNRATKGTDSAYRLVNVSESLAQLYIAAQRRFEMQARPAR